MRTYTFQKRPIAQRFALLLTPLAMLAVPASAQAEGARSIVHSAKSWIYQLQGNVGPIASTSADVAVVDPDHAGSPARFKQKPGGGRRVVLAYISVGEAERWRGYFKRCCSGGSPGWLTGRTQGWQGNYVVRFWEPAWKAIVLQRVKSALAAGYDGLYLDRVDTYESIKAPGGSRAAMIAFVREIAAAARAQKGDAAILVQNAEELLTDGSYIAALDGIAKEDLFHGIGHDGRRNSSGDIRASSALLKRARARGKAVFVVEYLRGSGAERIAAEIRAQGFVPNFAPRGLERLIR